MKWTAEWRLFDDWDLISPEGEITLNNEPTQSPSTSVPLHTCGGPTLWIPGMKSFESIELSYDNSRYNESAITISKWFKKYFDVFANGEIRFPEITLILRLYEKNKIKERWYLDKAKITAYSLSVLNILKISAIYKEIQVDEQ